MGNRIRYGKVGEYLLIDLLTYWKKLGIQSSEKNNVKEIIAKQMKMSNVR